MSHRLEDTPPFKKSLKKLINSGRLNKEQIGKTLKLLKENPFTQSLKTHKVDTRNYGKVWSSRVDGDLRIIWHLDSKDQILILLLDIGGHSGSSKVYK